MSDFAPRFVPTRIDSPIMEIALLIVGIQSDIALALGTGFIVAPYIAMTATHVVREFFKQFGSGGEMSSDKTSKGNFRLLALQYPRPAEESFWNVKTAVWSPHSDLCYLRLDPANDLARTYSFERTIALPKLQATSHRRTCSSFRISR